MPAPSRAPRRRPAAGCSATARTAREAARGSARDRRPSCRRRSAPGPRAARTRARRRSATGSSLAASMRLLVSIITVLDRSPPAFQEAAACRNSWLSSSVRRLNTGQLPRRAGTRRRDSARSGSSSAAARLKTRPRRSGGNRAPRRPAVPPAPRDDSRPARASRASRSSCPGRGRPAGRRPAAAGRARSRGRGSTLCAGHARHDRRKAEHLARLLAGDQEILAAEAERDADPFALRPAPSRPGRARRCAPAASSSRSNSNGLSRRDRRRASPAMVSP